MEKETNQKPLGKNFLDTTLKCEIPHNPPETYSDCFRQCLACVMGVDPQTVPHFWSTEERINNPDIISEHIRQFLLTYGYDEVSEIYEKPEDTSDVNFIIELLGKLKGTKFPIIIGGATQDGTNHQVVYWRDKIIMNPSNDESAISKCIEGKFLTTSLLVPLVSHWNQLGGEVK